MKLNFRKFITASQRGFTLIELVVVVAILGVLIAIVAPNVIGTKDGANAQLLIKTAQNVSTNWSLIAQSCGTTTTVASNPLPDATKTPADVIFKGASEVHATYKNCYSQSKVLALTEVAQPGAAAGTYNIAGYAVDIVGGGTSPLEITYNGVPENLILLIAQKYNPQQTALVPTGETIGGVMKYSAVSGTANVTIIKQI
jgi:prepilin-type N-terminal cleavage/methylation domain-containing protein